MIVQDFKNTVVEYSGFEIWDVENIDAFFEGNGAIKEIFEKEYHIPFNLFKERRSEIKENDFQLMTNILDLVGDKHFFLFTYGDANHNDLVYLQDSRIMNFGINIDSIHKYHVYIIIMDKIKSVGAFR